MKTLTTYGIQNLPANSPIQVAYDGVHTTTWHYSADRGFLTAKTYEDGNGTGYSHTAAGRIRTRTWARGSHTRYDYDIAGRLEHTRYFLAAANDTDDNPGNDPATPDVSFDYDSFNRVEVQTNGLATTEYKYGPDLRLDYEVVSYDWDADGTSDFVRTIDRKSDTTTGQPTGYTFGAGTSVPIANPDGAATYAYHTSSERLHTVTDGLDTFTYGYVSGSNLVETVALTGGGPAFQVTNTWEPHRNVLDTKQNVVGGTTVSSYDYGVNDLGQRESVDADGLAFEKPGAEGGIVHDDRDRTWRYDYLGQLAIEDDTPPWAEEGSLNQKLHDRAYRYDFGGNRLISVAGDTDFGAAGAVYYKPNGINQYVGVGGFSPSYDLDGNAKVWQLRRVGLAPYGFFNQLSSAILHWDGENRLIRIENAGDHSTIAQYAYDSGSRRIRRTIPGDADIAYLYDGWNPIAEYSIEEADDGSGGTEWQADLSVVNLWGLDLSGGLQGAGGVGGLLSVTRSGGTHYPTYDGNGNVSEYLAGTGTIAAHYEYDAFGNVIGYTESATGLAQSFSHRFSTKQQDGESGLLYYGFRYLDPVTGRWPSRDPIGERGGVNLYGFSLNQPSNAIDDTGLAVVFTSGGSGITSEPFGPSPSAPTIRDEEVARWGERAVRRQDVIEEFEAFRFAYCQAKWSWYASDRDPLVFCRAARDEARRRGYTAFAQEIAKCCDEICDKRHDIYILSTGAEALGWILSFLEPGPIGEAFTGTRAAGRAASLASRSGRGRRAGSLTEGGSGRAFAGHGIEEGFEGGFGTITVPEGTTIMIPGRRGIRIGDPVGNAIERSAWEEILDNPRWMNELQGSTTHLPGSTIPDLLLTPAPDLNMMRNSIRVSENTFLSELLGPNMGHLEWAACRECL